MVERNVVLGLDLSMSSLAIAKVREDRKDDERGGDVRPNAVNIDGAPYVHVAVALDKGLRVVAFGANALLWKGDSSIRVFSDFIKDVGQTKFYQAWGRNIRANEVALRFLTAVRKDIEECFFNRTMLSDLVSQCVVGIPACTDKDPEIWQGALKQVLTKAGFPNVVLCFNPVAAACYLCSEEEIPKHGKKKIVVYQMDSLSSRAAVVRAETGNVLELVECKEYPVGGRQFVDLLLPYFKKKLETDGVGLSPADEMPLRLGIEKLLKIPLSAWWSEGQPAEMEITLLNPRREVRLSLPEAEYKDHCQKPIKDLEQHILNVFRDFHIPLNSVAREIAALFFVGEYTYLAHAAKPDTAEFQRIPAPVGEKAPLLLAKGLALFPRFKEKKLPETQTPPLKEPRRGLWKYMAAAVLALLIAWRGPSLWQSSSRLVPEALYAILEVEREVCEIRSFDSNPSAAGSFYDVKATSLWEILPNSVRIWTRSLIDGGGKDSFKDYTKKRGNEMMPDLLDMLRKVNDPVLRFEGLVNTHEFMLKDRESREFSYEPILQYAPGFQRKKIAGVRIKPGPEGLNKIRVLVLFREKRYFRTLDVPVTKGKASLHYGALPPSPSSSPWDYAFERDKKRVTLKCVRVRYRYKDSSIETTHLPHQFKGGVLSVSHDLSSRRVALEFEWGLLGGLGGVDLWGVSERWADKNDGAVCPDVMVPGEGLKVWLENGQEAGR